jgi:hypothetical protein
MNSESKAGGSSAVKSPSEVLCSNLSQGLHAAAQPLTILRASLSKHHTDRMSMGQLKKLTAISGVEVERVCKLFSYLRELVRAESIMSHLSAAPILPLIAYVVDGVNLLYEEDGIFLKSIVPDVCQPVFIDRVRTLQALSSILLIAHGLSRAQDTVELIVSYPTSKTVRVVVRNLTSHVDVMNEEARLGLALAEANLRKQDTAFSWSPDPFSVQIELLSVPAV